MFLIIRCINDSLECTKCLPFRASSGPWMGFTDLFSVACSTSPGVNRYHYVFTLPASVLRHKATNFAHFRTTHDAKRYKLCFHFFLDFIQAMVACCEKKKPMPKGMNTLGFIEWCPSSDSKTHLKHCWVENTCVC